MNSTILTVMRKELARFFGDYRMVMTTILTGNFDLCTVSVYGRCHVKSVYNGQICAEMYRSQYTGRLVCRIEKKRFSNP